MVSLSIANPAAAATVTIDKTIKFTQQSIKQLNELLGKSTHDFVKLFINNLAFIDCQEIVQVRQLLEIKSLHVTDSQICSAGESCQLNPNTFHLKEKFLNDESNIYLFI